MKWKLALLAFLGLGYVAIAQKYFPKNDGVKASNNNYTALTNARIYISPGQVIDQGTLVVHEGKIIAVGKKVDIPANSIVMDLEGKSVYPSFIDVFSSFGVEQPKRSPGGGRSAQYGPSREGYYWNDHIMPEQHAVSAYKFDDGEAGKLRELGFGVVNSHIQDGIARGTGVLIALNGKGNDAERLLEDSSGQYFSFDKSIAKQQSYPTSLMGSMALLRQMYHDADWYARGNVTTTDRSLEALIGNQNLVQFFAAGDQGHVLRADGIGDAFGIQYVILAGGQEYENITDIKATGASLVVPLDFPDAFDVSNPYQAEYVNLEDMRHWNQAPSNPSVLEENGVPFAFTLKGLKNTKDLHAKIRRAMEYGLSLADGGATVLLFGISDPEATLPVSPYHLLFSEITLVGTYSCCHIETRQSLKLIQAGRVEVAAGGAFGDLQLTGDLRRRHLLSAFGHRDRGAGVRGRAHHLPRTPAVQGDRGARPCHPGRGADAHDVRDQPHAATCLLLAHRALRRKNRHREVSRAAQGRHDAVEKSPDARLPVSPQVPGRAVSACRTGLAAAGRVAVRLRWRSRVRAL